MCTSPITVRVPNRFDARTPVSRLVPCGHCAECLKEYQNGWKIRLINECLRGSYSTFHYEVKSDGTRIRVSDYHPITWSNAAFLTLTYRDEFDLKSNESKRYVFRYSEIHSQHSDNFLEEAYYKPFTYVENGIRYIKSHIAYVEDNQSGHRYLSCSRLHLTNWLKRFRTWYFRKYGEAPVFKYFYCTEYGPLTLRPHAHCIFFGLSQESLDWLRDDWYLHHGHVDFSYFKEPNKVYDPESIEKVANYVSKYSTKGVIFENPYVLKGIVESCVRRCSKGIGIRYILERKDEYLLKPYINNTHKLNSKNLYDEHYYNDEFYELFSSKLRYISPCSPQFSYKLPRYYLDKVLGTRSSALRVGYSLYLLRKFDSLYLRELDKIQSENPEWSHSQVLAFYSTNQEYSNKNREKIAKESLLKFYQNSNL